MTKQIVFAISILITLGIFSFTMFRVLRFFKLTKQYPVGDWGKRFVVMMKVAFGQTKIFRRPVLGLMHALVWWGFIFILIGSIEMIIDGLFETERIFGVIGPVYDIIIALGDVSGFVIIVMIIAFLFRRLFLHVKRYSGVEMKHKSHMDANFALSLIGLLMVSLLGMNTFYIVYARSLGHEIIGLYPVSEYLAGFFGTLPESQAHLWHEINWWGHILLIFLFANILPYSKHFHVFMSVPNVFLSRLEPLGYLPNMPEITDEVKLMMDPNAAFAEPPAEDEGQVSRFGVLDVEEVNWKNYLDSLACTECGRCTAVCPANITGKLLSPRKILMDLRARMKEKGPGLVKNNDYSDDKSLIRSYISEEELWACTTCNACAQECPININHPSLIVDMRRFLVMEESAAPGELNAIFTNIENNGAPWQFSPEDRMLWAEGLDVPLMADRHAAGKTPEYLLWIGSAGAFDDRYKKVSKEFVKVLNHLKVDYAVLGTEEVDSGDVARRAGNEMLFQMQALMIIETMNMYGVKKILTACPHDYNTFLNEYPDLGGHYEVIHHSRFLSELIKEGKLKLNANGFAGKRITFHDPCYLGRANGEYKAPREVIAAVEGSTMVEMKRNKSFALCCGAGGGQMFKEAEKGDKEVFLERIEDVIDCKADIVATACPFCMVMMTDGIKYKNREDDMKNYDIVELVSMGLGI